MLYLDSLALLVRLVGHCGVGQIQRAHKLGPHHSHMGHVRVGQHTGPADCVEAADVLESLGREVLVHQFDVHSRSKV